jgi:hypothetical protein
MTRRYPVRSPPSRPDRQTGADLRRGGAVERRRPRGRVMGVTASTSPRPAPRRRAPRRPLAAVLIAAATVLVLLTAACSSSAAPTTSPAAAAAAGAASGAPVSAGGAPSVCAHDSVVATYQTAYDGAQPLCRGFSGDADHAGEGLSGAETTAKVDTVVQWMLLHARAIYSFQPTATWLAASPHPRDVNGFFHRQTSPAPGDTALRAYKDFLTPETGQPGNEKDYALVAVIVSPTAQAEPTRGTATAGGGVWFVGCLVYHSDNHEYLEPCPSWVWNVPVVPAVKKRL